MKEVWRPALLNGESVELHPSVDMMRIMNQLGDKALRSKRGGSQLMKGAVVVTVRRPGTGARKGLNR